MQTLNNIILTLSACFGVYVGSVLHKCISVLQYLFRRVTHGGRVRTDWTSCWWSEGLRHGQCHLLLWFVRRLRLRPLCVPGPPPQSLPLWASARLWTVCWWCTGWCVPGFWSEPKRTKKKNAMHTIPIRLWGIIALKNNWKINKEKRKRQKRTDFVPVYWGLVRLRLLHLPGDVYTRPL